MLIIWQQACVLLKNKQAVAIPTETVYGLAANGLDDKAVAKIYALKDRPTFNPLILHVATIDQAKALTQWSREADCLARQFWQESQTKPLTLVLPKNPKARTSSLVTAGLDTVGVRLPAHPLAQTILKALDFPLAAPSANRSNALSPTTASLVLKSLGSSTPVVDGGTCVVGLESTILDLSTDRPTILRVGAVLREDLERALNQQVLCHGVGESLIKAPGMMKRHYAPSRPLRLNACDKQPGEALLGFGSTILPTDDTLSAKGDLTEAAAKLFAKLDALDRAPFLQIATMPIPEEGLGIAINDRLRRGAAV